MKSVSIVIGTLAALAVAALAGRYATGSWIFYTIASLQIQGAVAAFALAAISFGFYRHALNLALMVVAILIGAHGYIMLGEFRQPAPLDPAAKPLFRLLSINIMGDNPQGVKVADYIIGSGADVVFIQESAPIGPHIDRIKVVYPYRLGCGAQTITCDQSLWSKRPLAEGKVITASPIYRDRLMIATIDFDGRPVNFVNVHLTKPYFDNFHAYELRRIQKSIAPLKGPMILAGDFNASILTPDIRGFLKSTYLMTAEKEPQTWPVKATWAGMAIDHVFVRDALRFKSLARVEETLGSNHYGLIADVLWQDDTATYPPQ
ncbi:endonuclease/exonuclease/phosphatase family protein [Rhizobium sp. KVB221]|uniref:Endonuclease/exonuclease/phosphatase family protein n=1 Tax=Rhizobium setariae TaxID=2801340 RepID=A0A936YPU3_9HYPH|nr:endonuclease/exonuclease/phosphatase family protein [Rhizobium setariae]MBL0372004.1 endonuclease/exonuclease/phosphatase family protein [Rhizobium setariae]